MPLHEQSIDKRKRRSRKDKRNLELYWVSSWCRWKWYAMYIFIADVYDTLLIAMKQCISVILVTVGSIKLSALHIHFFLFLIKGGGIIKRVHILHRIWVCFWLFSFASNRKACNLFCILIIYCYTYRVSCMRRILCEVNASLRNYS